MSADPSDPPDEWCPDTGQQHAIDQAIAEAAAKAAAGAEQKLEEERALHRSAQRHTQAKLNAALQEIRRLQEATEPAAAAAASSESAAIRRLTESLDAELERVRQLTQLHARLVAGFEEMARTAPPIISGEIRRRLDAARKEKNDDR